MLGMITGKVVELRVSCSYRIHSIKKKKKKLEKICWTRVLQVGCILLWTMFGSNSCMHWIQFLHFAILKEKWKEKSLERERE